MAGHSHWSKIKYKKTTADIKKGQLFSKLAREIALAAKQGKDLEMNPRLRLAVEQAKAFNMPWENIERAIKKGTGEIESEKLEQILFEAFGPGGSAILIEGITDNKNRTIAEIKSVLGKYKGKLAREGEVKWQFKNLGCITVKIEDQKEVFKNKEKLELEAIEAGAEDIYWQDGTLDVYVKIADLEKTKQKLIEKGIKIDEVSLDWVPKEMIELDEQKKENNKKLFEELEDLDAVQNIFTNLKL